MKLQVLNIKGEATGRSVELPEDIFGIEPHEHSVWLDVKRYLNAQRQGTHKSKERREISGSTRKLHRQKGTGGSRKGDINNPLYRGGGRVFGPRPRSYDIQVNAKVKRLARRSALSSKAQGGNIVIVEDFTFDAPKTKSFVNILQNLKVAERKALIVPAEYDKMVYLSGRNLPTCEVAVAKDLSTYQIMKAGALVLTESAIAKLTEFCG